MRGAFSLRHNPLCSGQHELNVRLPSVEPRGIEPRTLWQKPGATSSATAPRQRPLPTMPPCLAKSYHTLETAIASPRAKPVQPVVVVGPTNVDRGDCLLSRSRLPDVQRLHSKMRVKGRVLDLEDARVSARCRVVVAKIRVLPRRSRLRVYYARPRGPVRSIVLQYGLVPRDTRGSSNARYSECRGKH